jgi:hypothetical protein
MLRHLLDFIWRVVLSVASRLLDAREAGVATPFETNAAAQKVYLDIQGLSPHNDLQRSLQS